MKLTREEQTAMADALAAYCADRKGTRQQMMRARREMQQAAADPRHPVFPEARIYRPATVRHAKRRLELLKEFEQRAKKACR